MEKWLKVKIVIPLKTLSLRGFTIAYHGLPKKLTLWKTAKRNEMLVDTFKFRIQIMGSCRPVDAQGIRRLIVEAYDYLAKRPNGNLYDAVKEAEAYLQERLEFEKYLCEIV